MHDLLPVALTSMDPHLLADTVSDANATSSLVLAREPRQGLSSLCCRTCASIVGVVLCLMDKTCLQKCSLAAWNSWRGRNRGYRGCHTWFPGRLLERRGRPAGAQQLLRIDVKRCVQGIRANAANVLGVIFQLGNRSTWWAQPTPGATSSSFPVSR